MSESKIRVLLVAGSTKSGTNETTRQCENYFRQTLWGTSRGAIDAWNQETLLAELRAAGTA